jgi:hypothetical protein
MNTCEYTPDAQTNTAPRAFANPLPHGRGSVAEPRASASGFSNLDGHINVIEALAEDNLISARYAHNLAKCSGKWGGPPGPQAAPWPAWAGRGRPARTRASAPQVEGK